ncbi:Probable terpene synthase 4 [Linum perenne]
MPAFTYYSSPSAFPNNITRKRNGNLPPPPGFVFRRPTAITTSYSRRHVSTFSDDMSMMERRMKRLAEARTMFKQKEENSIDILIMIDAIQRLGLDYHFEEDIAAVLDKLFHDQMTAPPPPTTDLFRTSLGFRLLRQHGYQVPSDVFRKFTRKTGGKDTRGMMELYEASFWGMKDERILDEGDRAMLRSSSSLDVVSSYRLRHPVHRSLPKFNLKSYLDFFHEKNDTLADLARLDFNVNQCMHKEEVIQVSRWWKELGLAQELKFVRNEPVKWYMWPLAALPDPKFSEERVEITKPTSLVYLIDDIFDIYGSLDELVLFTEVIDRWDATSADQLPDYMRKCFMALDEVTNEFGYKVFKRHGLNPMHFLQRAWAKMVKAFLVEAKWFKSRECPKAEEYLQNGIVSSSVQLVLVHLFFLLGHDLTSRNLELVNGDNSPVLSSVGKLLRLSDDLAAMNEDKNGCDGSYMDYYMKEHPESSMRDTREHVMEMIEDTWKQLNHECLSTSTTLPSSLTRVAHNSAKMVSLMEHMGDNGESPSSLEDHIKSMLFESIPI